MIICICIDFLANDVTLFFMGVSFIVDIDHVFSVHSLVAGHRLIPYLKCMSEAAVNIGVQISL